MKKIVLILLIAAFVAASSFAQEIKFSGEVKTGVFWKEEQRTGYEVVTTATLHSKDDAGGEGNQGRYRLNMDYDNGNGFGMRARIQTQDTGQTAPEWSYAFGYGNFFDDNLTIAIGKLGGSPWGTGGPEMWKELETGSQFGMRVEWKPTWVPESAGKFNVGFVLNYYDGLRESTGTKILTLLDILGESVIGFSWEHEKFLARFAVRLDSEVDVRERGVGIEEMGGEGISMVYRFEERVLRDLVPNLSIWALGYLEGLGAPSDTLYYFRNWLFVQYAPELFTAQVRVGYDFDESRSDFYVKPNFYWNFFDKLLSAGVMVGYCQDFGRGKVWKGSPYRYIEVEPKVQLNFSSSYIAFAYNFTHEYVQQTDRMRGATPLKQTQWMNLRFCIYY